METRKVYVSGGSTYVISLPKKWVKKVNLKAGDSLVVTEQAGALLFETSVIEKESHVKEIRISQMESSDALARIIIANYLVGYDTLKIKLDRKDNLSYRETVRTIIDYLIGIEIVEDTGDSIILEIMVDYKRMMSIQILQRMFSINRSMLLDLGKAITNRDIGLAKDVIVREREIDRLYFLVVRQLKSAVEHQQIAEKLGIKNQRDCLGYRIIVKVLERIADHIENIAKSYIQLCKTQKELQLDDFIKLNNSTIAIFEKSVNSLFSRNISLAEKIFHELKERTKVHSDISNKLFQQKNIQSAILQKTMLDSLGRIASYSGDIAEIAINMSAGATDFED
ncbi:MAG: phosphate uptake regulator PhoU [Candidatus Methanoperedens sp.]|uniref:phosphate signaling complex PhoU family protein n=1 Tax=Candidatus Methanoperedens sp. BLZ2 TaxID=2035255 RepID=UPI000BE41F66|nr:phosphate uptake regulator PhoU [Candidatus Methanoperedens sp. BLZ2]KAB2940733.1 MAG: phosphate uptake regulator PhoU [Candidatus Methanoperedens sp.]MBZ0173814.1 phosphate uptake regulator PhoU [Candidatus Methanoperedens nitroreducens]MCX9077353.1 phosphate uptake regulator PhoU [Candidatus Methanoperedens sp.]